MRFFLPAATAALASMLIAAASAPAGAQALGRDCIVSGAPSTFGINSEGTLDINSGESCNLYLRLGGTIESSRIVLRPKNGSLSMSNLSSAVYRSKAGYRGIDEFAFELKGRSMTGIGTSIVRIRANVQ
jgi:hypothetical protein